MTTVASNALRPPGAGSYDQAAWSAGTYLWLVNAIRNEASKVGGDVTQVGMPSSWPYGPLRKSRDDRNF